MPYHWETDQKLNKQIIRYYNEGYSVGHICSKAHADRNYVKRVLRAAKLPLSKSDEGRGNAYVNGRNRCSNEMPPAEVNEYMRRWA